MLEFNTQYLYKRKINTTKIEAVAIGTTSPSCYEYLEKYININALSRHQSESSGFVHSQIHGEDWEDRFVRSCFFNVFNQDQPKIYLLSDFDEEKINDYVIATPHTIATYDKQFEQKNTVLKSFHPITKCLITYQLQDCLTFQFFDHHVCSAPLNLNKPYFILNLLELGINGEFKIDITDNVDDYGARQGIRHNLTADAIPFKVAQSKCGKVGAVFVPSYSLSNYADINYFFLFDIKLNKQNKFEMVETSKTPVALNCVFDWGHTACAYNVQMEFNPLDASEILIGCERNLKFFTGEENTTELRHWTWKYDSTANPAIPAYKAGYQLDSMVFNEDGTYVAACFRDQYVRLINVNTGKDEILLDHGDGVTVTCVNFSSDGRRIISGSMDGDVYIW